MQLFLSVKLTNYSLCKGACGYGCELKIPNFRLIQLLAGRFGYWSALCLMDSCRQPDPHILECGSRSQMDCSMPSLHFILVLLRLMDSAGWLHRKATLLVFNEQRCDFNAYLNVFGWYLCTGWHGVFAMRSNHGWWPIKYMQTIMFLWHQIV